MQLRSDVTVKLIKSSANDIDVARAARVSTQGGQSLGDGGKSEGLINYLVRDRHGSPFEHNSFTFLVEAPIFVAREHMRHRAGWSYNEESGRYKELEGVFYMPDGDRPLVQVGKPGAYEFQAGTPVQKRAVVESFYSAYTWSYQAYLSLLKRGVAREVARMVLPVGLFTSYYATCNARSLMHFLSLRTRSEESTYPSFPQREIEMVAEQMEESFRDLMPSTHAAFLKHGRVAP
ncbi:FAD-dependent thymidylate synthase [Streptomyces sp. H27-H5]|uniref:FAD-dependent thymidylate synthase n=1 Tax=Streptomyces sp. H27-H5 TaxID=2996460 RepID=UPI00226D6E52|nr:FAD-dependent thymidylate synthase [Streptomyces sp. H27-H5]MCY0956384.1 FAD-dependent thymidylate synthase [Streptomyces sp. H27-H5]